MRDKLIHFQTDPSGAGEGGGQRPDWLLEKFNSPEDQARGYAEAEREMQRLRADLEREREQFADALSNLDTFNEPPAPAPQVYNPDQDPLLVQYQQALENQDARSMLAVQLELNRQMTAQAIQEGMKDFGTKLNQGVEADREVAITIATERVAKNFDNWQEIAPKVGEILQKNPHWIPEGPSVDGFETVLTQAAKLVMADELIAEKNRGEQSRQEKLQAQGLQGSGGRGPSVEESQAEWEKIKGVNLGGYSGIIGR